MSRSWSDLYMRSEGRIPLAVWNALVDRVREATVVSYVGGLMERVPGLGTKLATSPSAPGGGAILRTLFVTDASTADDGPQVAVSVGRILNLPVTIDGVELGADPAPLLPITTSGHVVLIAHYDEEGDAQGFEIQNLAELPEDTETEGHKILADVTLDDDTITVLFPVVWNLSEVQKCGATTYLWGGFGGP